MIRSLEAWSMRDATGAGEAEERDFCSGECFQLWAGCKSLWLTVSS